MKKIDGRRKVFEDRACIICNEVFKINIKNKIDRAKTCCSRSCASINGHRNSVKIDIQCTVCQKTFTTQKSKLDSSGKIYCSKDCWKVRFRENCQLCNREYGADRRGTKYCSPECIVKGQKQTLVDVTCDCCGIEFQRPSFTVASNKRVFCSKKCNSRQFSRENPSRYGSRWGRIRERKVKEDNYTCQRCNKQTFEPYGLNVHHIVPIDEFDNIDDANVPENLETLCFECHMEHHGISY